MGFQGSKYRSYAQIQKGLSQKSNKLANVAYCSWVFQRLSTIWFAVFFLTRLLQSFLNTDNRQPSMVGTIHTLNIGFSHLAASSLSSMIFLLNSKLLASNSTLSYGTSGQYGYDFLSLELWELETTLCKKPHIHNSDPLLYLKNDSPLVSPSFGLLVFLGPFPVLSNHLF